jgi:TonB family protein
VTTVSEITGAVRRVAETRSSAMSRKDDSTNWLTRRCAISALAVRPIRDHRTHAIRAPVWLAVAAILSLSCCRAPSADTLNEAPVERPIEAGSTLRVVAPISMGRPLLPAEAARQGIRGPVILDVRIDEHGAVTVLRVVRGHPMLNDLAQDAARQWKYEPRTFRGQVIPIVATVAVDFVD